MTRRQVTTIAIAWAATIGGAYLFGRQSVPTLTAEKLVSFDMEKLTVLRFASTITTKASRIASIQSTHTSWRYLPGGVIEIDQRTKAEAVSEQSETTAKTEASAETKETVKYIDREKLVYRPVASTSWSVGAALLFHDVPTSWRSGELSLTVMKDFGTVNIGAAISYGTEPGVGIGPALLVEF